MSIVDIHAPAGDGYGVIYADPPWSYRQQGNGAAARHYPTMTPDEIKALPVQTLAAKDCALLTWATFPNLQQALALIENKEKTLEIRRTAPYISPPVSENNPIDVWVYETKSNGGRGQVVGRFLCCNIRTFDAHRDDLLLRRAARVPWEKLKEYQGDHTHLYAWDITYYKKLAVPLPLSALGCNFAPQSWCKRKEKKA